MKNNLAYCGLDCGACPTFLATLSNDDEKRRETAALWSKLYHADIKPDDVSCDGCKSETGRLFRHCNVCEIRSCASQKKLDTCASCSEYKCEKIISLFNMAPEAEQNLSENS